MEGEREGESEWDKQPEKEILDSERKREREREKENDIVVEEGKWRKGEREKTWGEPRFAAFLSFSSFCPDSLPILSLSIVPVLNVLFSACVNKFIPFYSLSGPVLFLS